MSTSTTGPNGKPGRKQLSDQLDRLDGIIDCLAGGLSEAVADVVVTSYDMAYHEPVLFSSRERPGFVTDVSMRLAARATSAGPTLGRRWYCSAGTRRRIRRSNPSILPSTSACSRAATASEAVASTGMPLTWNTCSTVCAGAVEVNHGAHRPIRIRAASRRE